MTEAILLDSFLYFLPCLLFNLLIFAQNSIILWKQGSIALQRQISLPEILM